MIVIRNPFLKASAADTGFKRLKHADFDKVLAYIFSRFSHNDKSVIDDVKSCINDTKGYYNAHIDEFDCRGTNYSDEGIKWIRLIAAVNSLEKAGYAIELDHNATVDEFSSALSALLIKNGITFSLKNISFDPQKNIPDWTAQFNEYAGQSGITLYFIDIDSDSYVMSAAMICDYAEAADAASMVGIVIKSR